MTDHDEFLTKFRAAPRREFAERLYAELTDERVQPTMFTKIKPFVWRAAMVLAALVLVFGAVMIFSPTARAAAQSWLEITIGGVTLIEVPDDGSTIDSPLASEEVEIAPEEFMTREEAQQILPFKLPTWTPEGFDPSTIVKVTSFADTHTNGGTLTMIWVTWYRNSGREGLLLTIDDDPQRGLHVGESNGASEVTFNGKSGALFRGMWNAENGRYEGVGSITLMWVDGGLKYTLMGEESQGVTEDDLINIAASIE